MKSSRPPGGFGASMLGSIAAHAVVIAAMAGVLGFAPTGGLRGEPPVVRVLPAVEASVLGFAVPIERAPLPEPATELPSIFEHPEIAPTPPSDASCWWPTESDAHGIPYAIHAAPLLRIFPVVPLAETPVATARAFVPDPTAPALTPVLVAASVNAATCPAPDYPRLARRRGLEGVTNLLLQVGADGRVTDARVVVSSGHELLDEAALEAARDWRLVPATENGVPVAGALRVPLRFRLER